jgi:hypothetical protein
LLFKTSSDVGNLYKKSVGNFSENGAGGYARGNLLLGTDIIGDSGNFQASDAQLVYLVMEQVLATSA